MLAAITAGTAVCCFATAYGLHQVAPVKAITDEDEIVNKSTFGTVNLLPDADLKTKSLQELIDAYLDKRASLDDVMMMATQNIKFFKSIIEEICFVFLSKRTKSHCILYYEDLCLFVKNYNLLFA